MSALRIFSGGAAKGLVERLRGAFAAETGLAIEGTFSAVGGLKARIAAGERPDLAILTDEIMRGFEREGLVPAGALRPLGNVETSIAVRDGDAMPDVSSGEALRAALLDAGAIYFPDPQQATAGIHFAEVMRRLGIAEATRARHRSFPNGATAMAALAAAPEPRPIGCTQTTEILITPGVRLVAALPAGFDLATLYVAAPLAAGPRLREAARLADMLAASEAAAARRECGFI